MHTPLTLLGLLLYPVLCGVVFWRFGSVEGVRFLGVGILLLWLAMATAPRLFVHVEERQAAILRGWVKALAILPVLVVGLLVVMYPRETACFGGMHVEGC